jgi:hypothetical protein
MSAILIAVAVFLIVALAAFAIGSLLDERSARARLIKERLATVQKAPEREPNEEGTRSGIERPSGRGCGTGSYRERLRFWL